MYIYIHIYINIYVCVCTKLGKILKLHNSAIQYGDYPLIGIDAPLGDAVPFDKSAHSQDYIEGLYPDL